MRSSAARMYPYEVEYKGRTIRCLTLDHVRDILEELQGSRLSREVTPWTKHEFERFTQRIRVPQRRLLAELCATGTTTWLEDFKLRELLRIAGNQALAGVLSGISKVALSFGIEPRRIYTQTTAFKHGKPHRYYQITSAFLQAVARHNWPSKNDLQEVESSERKQP